jgi:hypothetical protein
MPSTARVRVGRSAVGLLRRLNPARRFLAHAAHTFSTECGDVPSRALQAPECGHPRSLAFEEQVTFVTEGVDPFGSLVPGTDDPSAPFGSTVVARLRELIALLVPTPDAVPRRLLRPRARGPIATVPRTTTAQVRSLFRSQIAQSSLICLAVAPENAGS